MSSWTKFRDRVTGVIASPLLGPMGMAAQNARERTQGAPGVDPNSPSAINASITREWWADQQARYNPLEDMANDMILNPERRGQIRQEGLDVTTQAVEGSFNRSADRLETLRSRTNQAADARSQRSNSRINDLTKTATTVTARNSARRFMDETENAVLGS